MRQTSIIVVLAVGIFATLFFGIPRLMLHLAKKRAIEEYAGKEWAKKMANTVPKSPPRNLTAEEYEDTVWMKIAETDCVVGFPADRFTRDDNPKRENVVIHHSRYRVLVFPGFEEFGPVMQPLGFTNIYDFVSTVFEATEHDIRRQHNMDSLLRHLLLLNSKAMIAPVGFEESCLPFTRNDAKGFIIGDPARIKNLFVLLYLEDKQQFISLGVIQETPIQMSDLEELIAVVKVNAANN